MTHFEEYYIGHQLYGPYLTNFGSRGYSKGRTDLLLAAFWPKKIQAIYHIIIADIKDFKLFNWMTILQMILKIDNSFIRNSILRHFHILAPMAWIIFWATQWIHWMSTNVTGWSHCIHWRQPLEFDGTILVDPLTPPFDTSLFYCHLSTKLPIFGQIRV